jgi:hemolysin activation/secretion protein
VQFSFDLFKKDSSFLNLNGMLGMTFAASSYSGGALFLQWQQSNLLSIDTLFVKTQKTLPSSADVRSASLGVSYDYNRTDYRTNPLKGTEAHLHVSAGTKTVRQNASITRLTDSNAPDFRYTDLYDSLKGNTYQLRVRINAAHFLRISRASTLKTALHAGWFQSPSIFRNELFQIGGYRLLRGFDEESIYASFYGVATLEYRYLFGRNSHFFVFSDLATARNAAVKMAPSNSFIGAGLGMMLETKTGILNISLAAGKRNDQPLNLRQAKIHFGYVSYF